MISPEFDFSEFIDSVKNRDKHIIFCMAESEAKDAEKNAEIKGHGQDYVEALMGFIYFLRYQEKPFGVSDIAFQMFLPVCKNLVAKKQVSSDILKLFD